MRRLLLFAVVVSVLGALALACSGDSQQPLPQTQEADPQPSVAQQEQAEVHEAVAVEPDQDEEASAAAQEETPAQQQDSSQQESLQAEEETPEENDLPQNKFVLGGGRPASLVVPAEADLAAPRPLIVLLHGYGSFARQVDEYFQLSRWIDERGFGVLYPEGTVDQFGARHWNGTDECCDIFDVEIDDVGYLTSLIAEAREIAVFDQVIAVGHSNGGFMSYRLACEDVPGLTAIVSLAGGAFSNPDDCRVPTPLSVLQIHGTNDEIVLYEGGRLPTHPDPDRQPVPGAWASVTRWAERAGCDPSAVVELEPLDTDMAVEGDETTIERYEQGCVNRTVMELWTIEGGGHIPLVWDTDFTPGILHWIEDRYAAATQSALEVQERVIGGERTARLQYPPETEGDAISLVLSLHGYSGEAAAHDWYFGLSERILEYRFALITPQGTTDSRGNAFWNATDACCNFDGSDVDDAGWLSALVTEASEIVDISGVHVVGYSNGGFMAYRLACDGLKGLVSIVSLAGSSFGDPDRCADAPPVSVLQIHGTADLDIPYAGTLEYEGGYPGAVEVTERWAERAGCDLEHTSVLPAIDLDDVLEGVETEVRRHRDGCADGNTVELWSIAGADHYPFFNSDWPDHLLGWLFNGSRTN
ncbi:MAG: alpha/beta fold hydrolase [Chloroflexi bacterium]|nr:alpha/beta fold hydrolase [Chloroflexota bacterium]MYF81621.1 alpha/beta fold hydrolase [Chloroflexota bacterium]MYI04996.1 alpha/beta fold hydrolase [Chloroflexota bacterium]